MNISDVIKLKGVQYDNAFLEYLDDRIGQSAGHDQIQAWESLPAEFKEYHALFSLDMDVFNGGFGQYFRGYATYPPFIAAAIRGLERVGATKHVPLVHEAISIFVHYIPELQPLMESLKIPQSSKQTDSDIDTRFREAGNLQLLRFAWLDANRETIRELA